MDDITENTRGETGKGRLGEVVSKMKIMPEQEEKRQIDRLRPICTCAGCPSIKGTGETALLFCYTGKSRKIKNQKGCICGGCPVKKQRGLKQVYYCLWGTEAEQRTARA
jgi:hypothetical protein